MISLLLKNGTVVRPEGREDLDVLMRDGKIVEMGMGLSEDGVDDVVDVTGQFVLPGVIDPHVHFRVPGHEYKEDWNTGSAAAVAGGVTTVLDMPNTDPSTTTRELLADKQVKIAEKSRVNYGLYFGATFDPATGHTNIEEYVKSEAIAMKVYMGSTTGSLLVDKRAWLEEIFEGAANADRILAVHAEDEALMREHQADFKGQTDPSIHAQIRSDDVAYRALEVAMELQQTFGTRLHVCHLSTARELELIRSVNSDRVSCEVTPFHLLLDQFELVRKGTLAQMNPPLRTLADNVALMEGIRDGSVTMMATDHAPHTLEEKAQPYGQAPSGIPGVETALSLMLDQVNQGALMLEEVVRVMSESPARVFGLSKKGRLEVGMDADVVVVDMGLEQTVERGGPGARYTKCGWSLFEGQTLKGWPVMTVVNGQIVLRDGQVFDKNVGREINLS